VTTEANCTTSPDTDKAQANFSNTPLTNTTVSIDSQVNGGTASTIDCELPVGNPPNPTTTEENRDGSLTLSDKEPGTCTCTIMVDP
jgi:hypothetical protein